MKSKEKYAIVDITTIGLIVLYSLYCLEPFFIWETFENGFFRYFLGVIPYKTLFGVLIVAIYIVKYMKIRMSKLEFGLVVLILFTGVFTICISGGVSINRILSFTWLPYLVVAVFIMLPPKIQKRSYEIFVLFFAITLILPIIYYILTKSGIHIPYTILESQDKIKVIRGKFYKLYPLCPQISGVINSKKIELRMSGIYDESGRLGTIAALILASERYNIRKNWKNIVIFIGGFLSFSLAFYLIGVIYFLGLSIRQKSYKTFFIIIGVLASYFLFIIINFSSPEMQGFQERFLISSDGLEGDNRTSREYDEVMNNFYRSDLYSLLFGKGNGAIEAFSKKNVDGSSYKGLIYDYGFIGFDLLIAWLCLYAFYSSKRKNADVGQILLLLIVYLANIYQRPTIFYMGYLIIMFGGMNIASDGLQNNRAYKQIIGRHFNEKNSHTFSNI